MNYREDSRNKNKLSILGFGCMRFPTKNGAIDEVESEKLIVSAIENGINYFDTAYFYHAGGSETFLGKVLEKGYRDKVYIATKLPPFLVKNLDDVNKIFNTQLKKLRTDHIDYYLIHMLQDLKTWERMVKLGILDWIKEKKANGQIKNIGFSYHGGREEFIKLIDAYDWEFCQIQYNFIDENNQAGKTGLEYAYKKNIPIIAMEPLRGGKIVNGMPDEINNVWKSAKQKRSAAEWGLRWVWNHKEVTLLLSGMGNQAMIDENVRIASNVLPDSLTSEEHAMFAKVKKIIMDKTKVPCTGCGYCIPCPAGVDIPTCFTNLNNKYLLHNGKGGFFATFGDILQNNSTASKCVKCGKCEKHCPQNIKIMDGLDIVKKEMEGFPYNIIIGVARKIMSKK